MTAQSLGPKKWCSWSFALLVWLVAYVTERIGTNTCCLKFWHGHNHYRFVHPSLSGRGVWVAASSTESHVCNGTRDSSGQNLTYRANTAGNGQRGGGVAESEDTVHRQDQRRGEENFVNHWSEDARTQGSRTWEPVYSSNRCWLWWRRRWMQTLLELEVSDGWTLGNVSGSKKDGLWLVWIRKVGAVSDMARQCGIVSVGYTGNSSTDQDGVDFVQKSHCRESSW